ncbi:hypothetical protein B0H10DRAFT_2435699 [Mycena sp. CBHHK59/15]|nr:hypothetical protein B0H10DRAFT_2435699 [Mycena sp. CBHHK59/15]
MTIDFDHGPNVEVVRTCLKNSKVAPLEIALEVEWREPSSHHQTRLLSHRIQAFLHTFFTLLDPHFPRIRVFRIICPVYKASELVLEYLMRMDANILTELYLVLALTPDPDISAHRPRFLSNLPSLRYLHCAKSFTLSSLRFTSATVTELRLLMIITKRRLLWDEVRETLLAFPRLASLKLGNGECAYFPDDTRVINPITFPVLDHLNITISMPSVLQILTTVDAPTLSSIRLTFNVKGVIHWFSGAFSKMLQRVSIHPRFALGSSESSIRLPLTCAITPTITYESQRPPPVHLDDCLPHNSTRDVGISPPPRPPTLTHPAVD